MTADHGKWRAGREGRVFPFEWLHGPASIEGEWITLDPARARAYNPVTHTGLMTDLAAVRRPSDALAFVQRYGLLRHGPGQAEYRERYRDIEEEAFTLSYTLRLHTAVLLAIGNDPQESNKAIRDLWELEPKTLRPMFAAPAATDDELVDQASQMIAWMTNEGLVDVDFKVEAAVNYREGAHGEFVLSAHSPSLVGAAYHQLALSIANRVPMRACLDCDRYFPVKDGRQQFCSTTCSSRARQRRWAKKKKQADEAQS